MTRSAERLLVVAQRRLSDDELAQVHHAAPGFEVITNPDDVAETVSRAEVWAGHLVPAEIRRASLLRWNHLWTAGADADLSAEMREASDIQLTTSAGNGGIALAEHALMLMLMLDRDALRWAEAQRAQSWDRYMHRELAGQTVGIIGMGTAGADLARKCQAFHMHVLGLRSRPERHVEGVDRMYGPNQIEPFAGECDYLVVAAPLTQSTRGMIDSRVLDAMKPTASVINISRGEIIDEADLRDALRSGSIAAAGLDAHATEPLPPASEWWTEPRVIVTPHNGATTGPTARRGFDTFVENLRRYDAGHPLINVVDKSLGYAPR